MRSRQGGGHKAPTMQQFNALKSAMNGQKLTMKRELGPPSISSRPFNSLCLKIFVQPEGTLKLISTDTVGQALIAQVGLSAQTLPKVNIKFRSVKAWAIAVAAGSDPPTVRLNVASITGYTPATGADFHPYQVEMSDTGTLSESARVGYMYPGAQQKIPVPVDAGFTLFAVTGNTPSVVLHVELSWALTDVAPEPTA